MRIAIYCAIIFGALVSSCAKIEDKKLNCANDTISVFAAYRMIHHYGDTAVSHSLSNILRYFRIDNNCLINIMAASDETTFWTGADTVNHQPLIIVETKGGSKPHPTFYAMKGIPLCPPPTAPPCDTLHNLSDFEQMFPLPPGY